MATTGTSSTHIHELQNTPEESLQDIAKSVVWTNGRLSCSYCDKSFTSRPNLLGHLRSHAGIQPFSCQTCSKSFRRINDLRLHQRTHLLQSNHPCSRCAKTFTRKSSLYRHVRTHQAQAPSDSASSRETQDSHSTATAGIITESNLGSMTLTNSSDQTTGLARSNSSGFTSAHSLSVIHSNPTDSASTSQVYPPQYPVVSIESFPGNSGISRTSNDPNHGGLDFQTWKSLLHDDGTPYAAELPGIDMSNSSVNQSTLPVQQSADANQWNFTRSASDIVVDTLAIEPVEERLASWRQLVVPFRIAKNAATSLFSECVKHGWKTGAGELLRHQQIAVNSPLSIDWSKVYNPTNSAYHNYISGLDIMKRRREAARVAPLHWACIEKDLEMASLLFSQQETLDLNIRNANGVSPLSISVLRGDEDMIRWLLAKDGIDPNSKDHSGHTALHRASDKYTKTNTKIVKLLLEHSNIALDTVDFCGRTAFLLAIEHERLELLDIYLESGRIALEQSHGEMPTIFFEVIKKHVRLTMKTANYLIDKGVQLETKNKLGQTVLQWALESAKNSPYYTRDILLVLVEAGARTDFRMANGQTALHWAVKQSSSRHYRLLLEKNPDLVNVLDNQGQSALTYLIKFKRFRRDSDFKCVLGMSALGAQFTPEDALCLNRKNPRISDSEKEGLHLIFGTSDMVAVAKQLQRLFRLREVETRHEVSGRSISLGDIEYVWQK